jgi:iron complex outermembrane recepter protein
VAGSSPEGECRDLLHGLSRPADLPARCIQGFELELAARPLPHLDLNVSYGYTDSKIKDFDGSSLYLGQSLPNMPKSTLNMGAQYGVPVGGDATVKGRLDYYRSGTISYQDFQNNADPNHFLFAPSYYTLDGQIGLDYGHWSLTGYVHNLTDQRFATSAYSRYIAAFIFVPFGKDPIQTDPGRLYGAEVRYRF